MFLSQPIGYHVYNTLSSCVNYSPMPPQKNLKATNKNNVKDKVNFMLKTWTLIGE